MGPDDVDAVVAAGHLFDGPAVPEATRRFLGEPTAHLCVAYVDGVPAGFVSGVETTHPDKGTEMLLYELGVDEPMARTLPAWIRSERTPRVSSTSVAASGRCTW